MTALSRRCTRFDALRENSRLRIAPTARIGIAVLKAFSDRPRDLDDLAALLQVTPLDLDYVVEWAARLDASIESNEVSERLRSAVGKAKH